MLCVGVFLLSAGCGDNRETANAANILACRTMDPREMSQSDYVCALAAEMKSIADALATIEDRASADLALPTLKKSKARIAVVVKERDRLNSQADRAPKAAMASANMPKFAAANRAFVKESTRIIREHPELWRDIGPALDGIDID